jgi:hypothetical protein
MTDITYRLIALDPECGLVGQTALTPELAQLVPGGLNNADLRKTCRLGIERTDWSSTRGVLGSGGLKPVRSVLVEAESSPGEWDIGAEAPPETQQDNVADLSIKRRKV